MVFEKKRRILGLKWQEITRENFTMKVSSKLWKIIEEGM
jgi:hypothetical protein